MNSRKAFVFVLMLANIAGLVYILSLGYLSLPAQDDYAFLTYIHRYGFNSSFLYWYSHWQGRFTAHYLINAQLVLWEHHFPMLCFYVFILSVAVYGTYNLIKNALAYFEISTVENKWVLSNAACFITILSVYSNFEFNTFYWLNVSAMYVGGVVFFILGVSEMIDRTKKLSSYLIVAFSFLYLGASSENFAFVGIALTCLILFGMFWLNRGISFNSFLRMPVTQKTGLAIIVSGVAFLIMVTAPGNAIRMHTINLLYVGYKTVPVPLSNLPVEVFSNYKILLVMVLSRLPLILSALPVFALSVTMAKPLGNKAWLKQIVIVILLFTASLYFFIIPTVYATADLGPSRSLTYLIFFLVILIFYIAFIVGNVYSSYRKSLTILAICSLLIWIGVFIHDTLVQFPQMQKYNTSERSRFKYLGSLKDQNISGVIVLDSLYTPHFSSYSNKLRNEIMDLCKKHNFLHSNYYAIEYDPLFYNEITPDTSSYINTDLRKALDLPFSVQLKH